MPKLRLTDELRLKLKSPIGDLVVGSPKENAEKLKKIVEKEKPPEIVCVGDVVSRSVTMAGIPVNVRIVDNKKLRKRLKPFDFGAKRIFYVRNSPGSIEIAAWQAVKDAVDARDALVVVDGEEDLLTLAAILSVSEGGVVLYGQPRAGMVIVRVDEEKKSEVHSMIESMIKED